MSKAALKNYGNLGCLIQLEGRYYHPMRPDRDDYDLTNDPTGLNQAEYLEDMKEWRKEIKAMEKDRRKLYALILQYLSDESLEEVKHSDDWETIEQETDPAILWDVIESTHKINTISKVESVKKMAARTTYQQMRQGAYENIITYKERFNNALKAYIDQKNPALDDKDVAMDFFRGLDNARYAGFKTEILNELTTKAIKQPENLNAMYLLANQWVKPVTRGNAAGFASTFTTTLDGTSRPCSNQLRGKRRGEGKKKDDDQQGGNGNPKENNNDRRAQVECFTCRELGNYANKCPTKRTGNDDEENRHAHVTWDASTFVTYQVHATGMVGRFKRHEVLLDNHVSIIHPSLLREIEPAESSVNINGVGGLQFTVDKEGYLDNFFRVYTSEDTHTNVLSFSEVEDKYRIMYVPQEAFIVHLPDRDVRFERRGKMYVADWTKSMSTYVTMGVYTEAEELRAKRAYELLRTSGYPSMAEAIHLVEDGNITDMPTLTREDVRQAYEMYGSPPEFVRGKMTKKKVSRASIDESLILDEKKQVLYSDVMHVDSNKFLITVCEPLQLVMQCRIERESQSKLGFTLQGQLNLLRSRSFVPTVVHTDPQSAFRALTGSFPEVVIDVGGAGDYAAKVDAKIRRIKENIQECKGQVELEITTYYGERPGGICCIKN